MFAARAAMMRPSTATLTPATLVGSAAAAASTVTIPTHQAGDRIVLFAYRSNNDAPPTIPTAGGTVPTWVDLANSGQNTNSCRLLQCVATDSMTTSGTWSNAHTLLAIVVRGDGGIGGYAAAASADNQTYSTAPAVTMTRTDGSSLLIHFHGYNNIADFASAPSGYTRLAAAARGCINQKNDSTSDGATDQPSTAVAARRAGATIEILAA